MSKRPGLTFPASCGDGLSLESWDSSAEERYGQVVDTILITESRM